MEKGKVMSEIKVNPIDADLIEAGNHDVPVLAQKCEIVISNQEQYETAAGILKQVKARYNELDKQRKEITTPLDAAKKAVMELYRKPLDLLDVGEKLIKKAMIRFTDEQERIARENQRELQRLAEIEAEKERKKLQAKIERAEASGKLDKVADLQEQKEAISEIVVPVVAPQVDKISGISFSENWKAEVIDFSKLTDEFKLPNMEALNKIAKATKGSLAVSGVRFYSEKVVSSRK